jgi:hypothetical protein
MTFKFFSVDNAGNVEAVQTQQVQVQANPDPVIGSAGYIACDPSSTAFNGGLGTATDCRAAATESLLTGIDAVLPLGDDQYDCGGLTAFQQSYGPTWGLKRPSPTRAWRQGLTTSGGPAAGTPNAGYQQYFSGSGSGLSSVGVNVDPSTGCTAITSAGHIAQHRASLQHTVVLREDGVADTWLQQNWQQHGLVHPGLLPEPALHLERHLGRQHITSRLAEPYKAAWMSCSAVTPLVRAVPLNAERHR